jgi:hypothetical protein
LGGRHAFNDDTALAEMARVLDEGHARSIPGAAEYVAAKLPGKHSLASTAKRLDRKYRRKNPGRNN